MIALATPKKNGAVLPNGRTAAARSVAVGLPAVPPQRTVRRSVREDGICVLTLDRPNSAANIFDRRALEELSEELNAVATASDLKGLMIISAKPAIFVAGADLRSMSQASSPDEIAALIDLGQSVMNQIAALRMPTVAAVHGAAVGGGFELCLACDYRVASNDRVTKLGLPETQLGLLPAWGGSTRLPRLIGLPKALDIILAGKTVAAKVALKRGLVDELAPVEYLEKVASRMLSRGKPSRRKHALTNNLAVAAIISGRLRTQLLKKTRGNYPAVLKALEVVCRGVSKSIASSLMLERDGILELIQTSACRNLIRLFFLQEHAKKQSLPGSVEEQKKITRTAVIGAGIMGAGIAQWLSSRGLQVILRDINTEQVAKGMSSISRVYENGLKRRVFTPLEMRQGLDRIFPAVQDVPLRHTHLVIEAAVENLELKKKIFRKLDELAGEDTVLATNTSALPISELAASTHRPERVVGLHFFNPVHRMQLVEIIAAKQTSPEVLQQALRFVQQLGKLPVIVKDSPGFLVNRILMPYLLEAGNLFEAGAGISDLDESMLEFGMPMGPMRLLDEVGIDVASHVAGTLADHYKERMKLPAILAQMIQAGQLGRKTRQGFYTYVGKSSRVNAVLNHGRSVSAGQSSFTREDLQERLVLLMINEAARCLEEEIVADPADVDFAMVMGTGFAPFRGGPLRHADALGLDRVVAAMNKLVGAGQLHFQPCHFLQNLAASNKTFYPAGF